MAVPKKKRCVEPQEESSDSENFSDGEINQENEPEEIIEVDFDVRIPEYEDRLGIKNLLQQLFLKAHVNTSEIADLLIELNNVTGVIKQAAESDDVQMDDDDDDMDVNFGVFSIINLTEKRDRNCVKQICSYLLDHCREVSSKNQHDTFKKILEDSSKPVGLIISERFVNIPAKISVPLYSNLSKDIEKEGYNFAYYIIISKIATFKIPNTQENEVYMNPEEELIAEEAEFAFEFQVQAEQDSGLGGRWTDDDDEGIPKRKVLLIPNSKWKTVIDKLSAEFNTHSEQQLST